MEKHRIKKFIIQFFIYNQKNKLKENRFYLQTKTSMNSSHKKKFTKNFMEGQFP